MRFAFNLQLLQLYIVQSPAALWCASSLELQQQVSCISYTGLCCVLKLSTPYWSLRPALFAGAETIHTTLRPVLFAEATHTTLRPVLSAEATHSTLRPVLSAGAEAIHTTLTTSLYIFKCWRLWRYGISIDSSLFIVSVGLRSKWSFLGEYIWQCVQPAGYFSQKHFHYDCCVKSNKWSGGCPVHELIIWPAKRLTPT